MRKILFALSLLIAFCSDCFAKRWVAYTTANLNLREGSQRNKTLMKRLLLCFVLIFPLLAHAQVTKERRVYYLDCTYTMKNPNKIWDSVRDNLKKAINNVNDETTELIVIPFWNRDEHLTPYQQPATALGKKKLCDVIDGLDCPKASYTVLGIPIEDFYNNRVSADAGRVTYMFFMTDGANEEQQERYERALRSWGQRFGDKQVYGFYVMLCDAAKNGTVEGIINQQPHLWKVETADININIIRLSTKAVFNVRNDKYVDIPFIGGDTKGVTFDAQLADCTDYHATKTEIAGDKLRVYIEPASGQGAATLPDEIKTALNINMKGNDTYTFLVTDKVELTCYNKKQYALKVSVRQ